MPTSKQQPSSRIPHVLFYNSHLQQLSSSSPSKWIWHWTKVSGKNKSNHSLPKPSILIQLRAMRYGKVQVVQFRIWHSPLLLGCWALLLHNLHHVHLVTSQHSLSIIFQTNWLDSSHVKWDLQGCDRFRSVGNQTDTSDNTQVSTTAQTLHLSASPPLHLSTSPPPHLP